jgi:hypothetical protein
MYYNIPQCFMLRNPDLFSGHPVFHGAKPLCGRCGTGAGESDTGRRLQARAYLRIREFQDESQISIAQLMPMARLIER